MKLEIGKKSAKGKNLCSPAALPSLRDFGFQPRRPQNSLLNLKSPNLPVSHFNSSISRALWLKLGHIIAIEAGDFMGQWPPSPPSSWISSFFVTFRNQVGNTLQTPNFSESSLYVFYSRLKLDCHSRFFLGTFFQGLLINFCYIVAFVT